MAAFVAALALLFHVAAMALSAGRLPDPTMVRVQAQLHAHSAVPAAKHDQDTPNDGVGHKLPCCILCMCPGLPLPVSDRDLSFLPWHEGSTLVVHDVRATDIPRLPLLPPVGARGPPTPV